MKHFRGILCALLILFTCTICASAINIANISVFKLTVSAAENGDDTANISQSSIVDEDTFEVSEISEDSSNEKASSAESTAPENLVNKGTAASSSSPDHNSSVPESSSQSSSSATPPSSSQSSSTTSSPLQYISSSTLISGTPQLTSSQLVAVYSIMSGNKTPKLTCSLESLASYYISYGKAEGIRGDIAFFQACIETGYFQYGGDVKWDQNNFAGLGATGGGNPGVSYDSAAEGVLGHIQHLKCYANRESFNLPLIDKRYWEALRGTAPRWIDLTGKWASDPSYGTKIISQYNKAIDLLS